MTTPKQVNLNTNIRDICNFIWDIEEKYHLFSKTIDRIYFWELIRFRLLHIIYDAILENQPDQKKIKKNKKVIKQRFLKFKQLLKSVYFSYLYGTFNKSKTVDILIFEHPRKVVFQDLYIDIYTNDFVNKCKKNNINYELIEAAYNGVHYCGKSSKRSYLDHNYFSFLFQALMNKFSPKKRVNIFDDHIKLLRQLQDEIYNQFNVKIDLYTITINQVSNFKLEYNFYDALLVRKKTKRVYLVVSYGQKPLVAACKKNNIEIVEFQHGFMGKYHLGYSYPSKQKIHYFPDKLMLFGKYWYETTPLPLNEQQIVFDGFPYIEKKIKKITIKKIKNQILFISQQPMGEKLFKIAYNFALKYQNFTVIFKPHPSEITYGKIYPSPSKLKALNNLILIRHNSIDTYSLLASSEFVVGIFSTAIFEAIALGCKAILVNLLGIENMEYFLERSHAFLVNNENDIYESINNYSLTYIDPKLFFANL